MNAHTGAAEHPAPDVVGVLIESGQMQSKPSAETAVCDARLPPELGDPVVKILATSRRYRKNVGRPDLRPYREHGPL